MAEQTRAPRVRADLPPATTEELEQLADLIAEAREHWGYGSATLARAILNAGYRLVPEPPAVRYGECRSCAGAQPLTVDGFVVEHDDPRPGHGQCLCSRTTPARIVVAPEAVAADG